MATEQDRIAKLCESPQSIKFSDRMEMKPWMTMIVEFHTKTEADLLLSRRQTISATGLKFNPSVLEMYRDTHKNFLCQGEGSPQHHEQVWENWLQIWIHAPWIQTSQRASSMAGCARRPGFPQLEKWLKLKYMKPPKPSHRCFWLQGQVSCWACLQDGVCQHYTWKKSRWKCNTSPLRNCSLEIPCLLL